MIFFTSDNAFCQVLESEIPYHIDKRILPENPDFNALLPEKVGDFVRVEYQDPKRGQDGEALYKSKDGEIFMLFSHQDNATDVKEVMNVIMDETNAYVENAAAEINLETDPAYIQLVGPKIAFFAWNRGLYCFSVDSSNGNKMVLNNFMNSFPY